MITISDLINAVLSGQPIPLATVFVFLVGTIGYRIFGKHIDELYFRIRRKKTSDKIIMDLQRALIDEMRRADEAKLVAEKHIKQANDFRWALLITRGEVASLKRQLDDVANYVTTHEAALPTVPRTSGTSLNQK